jgi:hypothetical protein
MALELSVRGYSAYSKQASWSTRILASLTDLPLYFLLPTYSILHLGVSPLPSALTAALWLLTALGIYLVQRAVWKRTLGGAIWGLQWVSGNGVRSKPQNHLGSIWYPKFLLVVALSAIFFMGEKILQFHPIFQQAPIVHWTPFHPQTDDEKNWVHLSFYLTEGFFPSQIDGDIAWYELPYSKGPPERFASKAILRLPHLQGRMILESPQTPDSLRGKRGELKNCLTSEESTTRWSTDCLSLKNDFFARNLSEIIGSSKTPDSWKVEWFELSPLVMGVHLSAQLSGEQNHRYILINSEGQNQAYALETHASEKNQESDIGRIENLVRSLQMYSNLDHPIAFMKQQASTHSIQPLLETGDLTSLRQASIFLVAQATVEPGNADLYFQLAQLSHSLFKKSGSLLAGETLASGTRTQALAAQKFMQDVAPLDPRNAQLKQLLVDLKRF